MLIGSILYQVPAPLQGSRNVIGCILFAARFYGPAASGMTSFSLRNRINVNELQPITESGLAERQSLDSILSIDWSNLVVASIGNRINDVIQAIRQLRLHVVSHHVELFAQPSVAVFRSLNFLLKFAKSKAMGLKRRGSSKSPPILSHEFIIQNHADIVACLAMIFVFGLMFQVTSPAASMFMAIAHNLTLEHAGGSVQPLPVMYTYGMKDLCVIFFYFLICIVMHAIVQEYVLDKINRKLHLSKLKQSKFNESGQLLTFYLVSVFWGGDIIFRENYISHVSSLWEGYPYHNMTFMFKFFFIVQICYWLHCFPELYFQKTKKDEIPHRVMYSSIYLTLLTAAYLLNFTRVAICLIVLHYIVECVFHFARLMYFAEKTEIAKIGFTIWNGLFVLVRLASITLSVLTFWYGLSLSDNQGLNLETGNFNTPTIRLNSLVAVCVAQAWMMWNFITFQLKHMRERSALAKKNKVTQSKKDKKAKKDEAKRNYEEEMNYLPEVDQNTKKVLRKKVATIKSRR